MSLKLYKFVERIHFYFFFIEPYFGFSIRQEDNFWDSDMKIIKKIKIGRNLVFLLTIFEREMNTFEMVLRSHE